MRHKMIASWPGPDPAIHVYRRPRGVNHRVKPGDDDMRVSGERRPAMRSLSIPEGEGRGEGDTEIPPHPAPAFFPADYNFVTHGKFCRIAGFDVE